MLLLLYSNIRFQSIYCWLHLQSISDLWDAKWSATWVIILALNFIKLFVIWNVTNNSMNSKQHSCSITLIKALFFKLHTIFKLCLCKRNCNSGIFSSSAILFSVKQCKIISSLKYQIYYYCAKQKRTHKTLKQDFTPESFFIKAKSYFYCRFF